MKHLTTAEVPFSQGSVTTSAHYLGTWSSNGQHYSVADIYLQSCPYNFCSPPIYTGSYWFHIGNTSVQTAVCVPSQSVLDSAAVTVAVGWPIAPYELSVSMKCSNSAVVTYFHFTDSFGIHYPGTATGDPCSSGIPPGAPSILDLAGILHTHPYFTTPAEYHAGTSSHGDTSPPITPAELLALNSANENFSPGDGVDPTGRAEYLRTPTGKVKRWDAIVPMASPVQVYP